VGAGDGAGAGAGEGAGAGAAAGAGAGAEAAAGSGASPSDSAGAAAGAGSRWSDSGPAGNGRRCDADETPESSEASEASGPDDVPTPGIETEIVRESEVGHAPTPIYQPSVSTNELRLPIGQFKDHIADLALHACTVRHALTQASIADPLKLSSTAAKYRTPFLLERFIDPSINLEMRAVDCGINGCVAFTHLSTQQTVCDACGAAKYVASGKPAKQVIYWSLIAWLTHLLGDPVIGKAMLKNMAAARTAAEEGADGVHDYSQSEKFRHYLDRKLLDGGPFIPVNVGTDGFQFFRQNGFEGWPGAATPLRLSPDQRARNKHQLLLVVSPGPKQPVDLELFLHPIAEELNELAKGVPGRIIPNSTTPVTLRAGVLNFTTDQPGGNKRFQSTGVSSYVYNRLRILKGVYVPASSHIHFPPTDPSNGDVLFKELNCTAPRRTAASIAASAAEIENARAEGKSVAYQTRMQQKSGVKGCSLFFAPSPAARDAYPHLKDLWDMGPPAAPYDIMHLVLLNVVPHLWRLFSGLKLVNKKKGEDYIMRRVTVARIGRELRGARRTVPMAQERSLRNIDVHHKSFKAIDWMHFILCSGEVLLAGRIPSDFFDIFIALSRACRLLFRPRGVLQTEIEAIDKDFKHFVSNYYTKIYRGTTERLPFCLSTNATLLDIVPLLGRADQPGIHGCFPWKERLGRLASPSERHRILMQV